MSEIHEAACDPNYRPPTRLQLFWKAVKWHSYLLCLRLFYQHWSRLLHRFNLHQMRRIQINVKPFYRCEWCGMHGTRVEKSEMDAAMAALNGGLGK